MLLLYLTLCLLCVVHGERGEPVAIHEPVKFAILSLCKYTSAETPCSDEAIGPCIDVTCLFLFKSSSSPASVVFAHK